MEMTARKVKIVADSAANVLALEGIDYTLAPLKIITEEREFVDDAALDVAEMVGYLEKYTGRTRSACPGTGDWLNAFGDAEEVFCLTITGGLSGSYRAACVAKQLYEDEYPDRRVFVLDSLSAGPEIRLMVEKLAQLIAQGMDFDDICVAMEKYRSQTGLLFMLKSLNNFANNGRVSPLTAKLVGIAGICIVGKASDEGTLEPKEKCRGEKKSLAKIADLLAEEGLVTGRVSIAHCQNPAGAVALQTLLRSRFPNVQVDISTCRGLCSFYAEKGGLLVGFEKF